MASSRSRGKGRRKQLTDLPILRILDIAGFSLMIVCLLLSLGFVLIEAVDSILRR